MDIWALIYALSVDISPGGGASVSGNPKYVVFGCFVSIRTYPSEKKTDERNLKIDPTFYHLLPTPTDRGTIFRGAGSGRKCVFLPFFQKYAIFIQFSYIFSGKFLNFFENF